MPGMKLASMSIAGYTIIHQVLSCFNTNINRFDLKLQLIWLRR